LSQSPNDAFAGDKMDVFLKSSTIEDILKARNNVSGTQTSQDSEKKEIVYDNYYELIKLNATLDTLSNPSTKKDDDVVVQSHTIGDTYVDDTLKELEDFVTKVASKYSTDFFSVVRNLNIQQSDDTASLEPIKQDHQIPEDVDRKQLVSEISKLLSKQNLQEDEKTSIGGEIDDIIQSLDDQKQELLILQLNELKKQYK
jgi:PleD family two-component response regulator